jgi:predicted nucleic acid-binding protein
MNGNMQKIDFNSPSFRGFESQEDILMDTGIIIAFLNEYDSWHKTVDGLFTNHVFNENDNTLFLYVNPAIVNEVTFLLDKPAEQYESKHNVILNPADKTNMTNKTVNSLKKLIDEEVLIVLDGNKESVLKQLEIFTVLGSIDAANVAIANEYGISFLTVDNKLVNNLLTIQNELKNIRNLYYTNPSHKYY